MRIDPRRFARRAAAALRRAAPPAPPGPPPILSLHDIAELPRDMTEAASRALASPVYLGGGIGLCRLLTRYKFHVATDDLGFGANVLLDGFWESWLTRFMARTVRPGGVVVDVGANCGYYSLLLADLVGPEGRLFAVEPNPAMADLLARSISLNGFAERTQICRSRSAPRRAAAPPCWSRIGSRRTARSSPRTDAGGEGQEVAVRRLDALLGPETRIAFIKIDAEGGEEAIVEGMGALLDQRPPMVIEFNAARYADPAGFLRRLVTAYGAVRYVEYDGLSAAISSERVLGERFGEDWLLVFGCS